MNQQRNFDRLQKEKLGKYIYALRDPRDNKIFYIGQGVNDRLFDHFAEAEINCNFQINDLSSKVLRILDIWKNNEDVEWLILAHNLPEDNNVADHVESGIFDSLSESPNGETYNNVNPPKSSRLLPEDIEALAAEPVNPDIPINNVFVFPIHHALNNGNSPYNATRTAWPVSNYYRNLAPAYAVGINKSISRGSYKISQWTFLPELDRYEFTSPGHPNPVSFDPLLNKNWNNILGQAKGFWQRGNYLVVEFDGAGRFRILRGSKDSNTWHNCI